jgi:hypothetical protein
LDGHETCLFLKLQPLRCALGAGCQNEGGADVGMAGKGKFRTHRENPHLGIMRGVARWQDERRLGVVELRGDRLHLFG